MTMTQGISDYRKDPNSVNLTDVISKRFPHGGICDITGRPQETIYEQDYEICADCIRYVKRHWPEKKTEFAVMRQGSCLFCTQTYLNPVNFFKVRFYVGLEAKKRYGFNYKKSHWEENRQKALGNITNFEQQE